ncbi:uncharacterized protein FOMMEDRAFT_18409 [Fomitiporia mediterranea MF3/22]|uniref:uncharacterized protein n=1 Tax=Fomitiporia mediterranea (strain MF3/22) TaxID=694068 RepID=UPI00044086A4|nr:uncharacterized protein FOMMEDRAFT_18409 [Fomitiporia mediterranea MF3/22]EJD06264.1 hypothetical protein FOMMEDRAFT_18409 [Fomitiporia mediterranea MF3/22]
MKVLVIGGSRNIGYYASQRLLNAGATVTFLLRKRSCFDSDESIKPYIASGKARLVQGDALKEEDVSQAWEAASEGDDGPLDVVLFSVGGVPKMSITKGAVLDPPDICTRCMVNLLSIYPRDPATQPKLVLVSSNGLSKSAHSSLPFVIKPLYSFVLDGPHKDKLGMERTVHHAAGWEWPTEDGEPSKDILPDGWQARVNPQGWLKHVVVVRPALLTDGDSKGDEKPKKNGKPPYRTGDKDLSGSYTVSRKDIAHFIVTQALAEWPKWDGKCIRVAN